jgi:hypothetical protein
MRPDTPDPEGSAAAVAATMPAMRPSMHPVLDPARLSKLAEASARELIRQGQSGNTRASYEAAMRYWCAWFAARYGRALALPVPVPVVVQFIVDHAAREADEEDRNGDEDGDGDVEALGALDGVHAVDGRPGKTTARKPGRKPARKASRKLKPAALVFDLPPAIAFFPALLHTPGRFDFGVKVTVRILCSRREPGTISG